ncbi:hypothetical protein CONLIGDRAFT_688134 [Coniochaeta ligniaria NRRL 30616]|uniref:Uncharacterized protein n=1 Tax=Coniochaeta ligniaria NRRL 30616 TaxID=1408157 RepID=A0A1J7K2F6_9PEZI|nr:hypothetical protein CONLIGDRAFT_688134 [Coniochaeta ligniaria NRRL 30616]
MAANSNITTLRRVLTQLKPLVPCETKAYKNTRGRWPNFGGDTITVWNDFSLDNLNESYGHILDLQVAEQRLAVPQPDQMLAAIEIAKSDDVLHLLKWSDEVLWPTLNFAREHLNIQNGVFLRHNVSTPDKSTITRLNGGPSRVTVDHFIALDEYPVSNLVVGIGKPSSKFHGRELADHPGDVSQELMWPLRQLANLCKTAKTRYGYILTDEDLVACCFSQHTSDKMKVALMPIPWSRHGENQLTTDLALWWLSMLAMSGPQHRAIVREAEMVRINEWEIRYAGDERGWVRRHRYSNFEGPADSPPPPVCRPPSPGNVAANAAAFAAQVGINADPLFSLNPMADGNFDGFDIEAYLNPAAAGNPMAANLGDFNFVDLADLDAAATGRGSANSHAAWGFNG